MSHGRSTAIGLFCERIIEGCWLAAVVVTPLFFNVYSSRIFEPDKTALLRSIVLIMGLAWIVRGLEHRRARRKDQVSGGARFFRGIGSFLRSILTSNPLVALVLLLVAVYGFATAVSVAPRFSAWGSYARLQGFYTVSAYVVIFFSVVALLRSRAQTERLITAAIVTSLPVSLYGLIQYFGTDPMPWEADVTARVASSMGNPVFVAAFLILIVPLTLYRLLVSGSTAAVNEGTGTKRVLVFGGVISLAFQMASWQAGPTAGTASAVITVGTWVALASLLGRRLIPFLRISSYTVLLAAQLMCILFSQSRGPWLGLTVGLFVFAFLWTLVLHRWKQAMFVLGGGLTIAVLLVAINWPGSPLGVVRDVPYLGRLGQLTETGGGSARVRVLIWEGIEDLVADDPVRTLVGYGPETLQLVFPPHYPPELGRVQGLEFLPDRAHNETFDALVTTGIAGLAVYLLIFTCVIYYGLRWTGLLDKSLSSKGFFRIWFVGGGAGVLLAYLIDGSWRFAGVALAAGMMGGLLLYIGAYGVRSYCSLPDRDTESAPDSRTDLRLLVIALVAAVIVHFVETQFGFAIAATRTYFWTYTALFVAVGCFIPIQRSRSQEIGNTPSDIHPPVSRASLIAGSLVVGLILVTLVYDLVVPASSLGEAPSVSWLLAFTWAFAGFIVITETRAAHLPLNVVRHWFRPFGVYGVLSLGPVLVYAIIHGSLLRAGANPANVLPIYYGAVGLVVVVVGLALRQGGHLPTSSSKASARALYIVYLVLTVATVWAVWVTNIDGIRADIYFKQALHAHQQARYERAVALYRRTVEMAPGQDVYHLYLGKALVETATQSGKAESRLREAERALLKAREVSPLNRDHAANLARLYRVWGRHVDRPSRRTERFRKAIRFFEQATNRSPNSVSLWNEMGTTFLLMGDTTEALGIYRHSLTVDDASYRTHLLLGNVYYNLGRWEEAASAYEKTIELNPRLPQVRLALAAARAQMERRRKGNGTQSDL